MHHSLAYTNFTCILIVNNRIESAWLISQDHGAPNTCSPACGDIVLDFWARCDSAVASSFGAALHDQLAVFATTCQRSTGAGGGSGCPEDALFDATVTIT